MTYPSVSRIRWQVGYLYQTDNSGRDFANGFGPLQNNLRIVSTHGGNAEALQAGAKLIGSKSPMGVIADAYLVRATKKTTEVLGGIRKDGTLDCGWARPKQAAS